MRGLYAIADVGTLVSRRLDPVRFAHALLRAKPAALQVRDKRGDARDTLAILRAIAPRAREQGVPLYANDRPDLAVLAGCSGLHLGQHDLPGDEARRFFRDHGAEVAMGISVHNALELDGALDQSPDYIALGPVFPTRSKDNPDPAIGLSGLAELAQRARARSSKPLVAIGGIDVDNAPEIRVSCDAGAVIGALVDAQASDPYEHAARRAEELHRALGGAS